MRTVPVNHVSGPLMEGCEPILAICMSLLLLLRHGCGNPARLCHRLFPSWLAMAGNSVPAMSLRVCMPVARTMPLSSNCR